MIQVMMMDATGRRTLSFDAAHEPFSCYITAVYLSFHALFSPPLSPPPLPNPLYKFFLNIPLTILWLSQRRGLTCVMKALKTHNFIIVLHFATFVAS